jgi:hypothetical protein
MSMLDEHSDVLTPKLQALSVEEGRSERRQVYIYRVKFELKLPDIGFMDGEAGSR